MRAVTDKEGERLHIISAAYARLDKNGGTSLSVGDILDEASLSTRAFYRHFDGKGSLLLEMLRRDREQLVHERRRRVARARDPHHALVAWIEFMLDLVGDRRRRARTKTFYSEEIQRTKGYWEVLARHASSDQVELADILHDGLADGSFPLTSPEQDARLIRSAIEAALIEHITERTTDRPDQSARAILEFTLRGVGYQDASGRASS